MALGLQDAFERSHICMASLCRGHDDLLRMVSSIRAAQSDAADAFEYAVSVSLVILGSS